MNLQIEAFRRESAIDEVGVRWLTGALCRPRPRTRPAKSSTRSRPKRSSRSLLEEDSRGLDAAKRSREDIARAAAWVAEALGAGGRVVFAGAGTSGRLGILEAAECPPTFGTDPDQIRAVIAGGPEAVFSAREGAEDVSRTAPGRSKILGAGDLLIAVSASSATPFVLGALESARDQVPARF